MDDHGRRRLADRRRRRRRRAGARHAAAYQRPWRVLVVDDDADVHAVTRLALRNVSFKGRELELFSAYSGAEGFRLLRDTADIALVLLDVVMETEDAGLILARRIREELDNQTVRVVLRTGQPGQAPEQRVIIDYDINDYKAKTELTTQRLFTAVISALRAYETLTMLERAAPGPRHRYWPAPTRTCTRRRIRLREFKHGQGLVGAQGRDDSGEKVLGGQLSLCLVVVDVVIGDHPLLGRLARLAGAQHHRTSGCSAPRGLCTSS